MIIMVSLWCQILSCSKAHNKHPTSETGTLTTRLLFSAELQTPKLTWTALKDRPWKSSATPLAIFRCIQNISGYSMSLLCSNNNNNSNNNDNTTNNHIIIYITYIWCTDAKVVLFADLDFKPTSIYKCVVATINPTAHRRIENCFLLAMRIIILNNI